MEKGNLKGMFVSGNIPAGAEYKAALHDVLKAFPYFQLAQVLFAKQMYDTHEPEASSRIKLASVYAPDRKAMYQLFKKPVENADEPSKPATTTVKTEKGEVKYNFVYSSTTVENIEVSHTVASKEEVIESLSETFIQQEAETKPPVKIPAKEPETSNPKVEEKLTEIPKIQPFISVSPSLEKNAPVEEKPVEVKKETMASEPVKKPYTPPNIDKKKAQIIKTEEPAIVKPLVSINPTHVPDRKGEKKEEKVITAAKPVTPPKLEEKKPIEVKKPEQVKAITPIKPANPPILTKPPVIERKPLEKKPEQVDASGRKPYTKPTIVWKRSLYANKPPIKKTDPLKPTLIIEKPVIEKKPVAPVVEEKKLEQPIVQVPIVETPIVEQVVVAPIIEETKVEQPIVTTPVIEKIEVAPIVEETKIEEPVIEPVVSERPVVEKIEVAPVVEEVIAEELIVEIPQLVEEKIEEKKKEPEEIGIVEAVAQAIETPKTEEIEAVSVDSVVEERKVEIEPIVDGNLKYSFNSWLKVLPEISADTKEEIKPVSQEQKLDIIEKFLKKESSISRPKAEFFSPVKAAQKSITDDDTIVSETLANIYYVQGNYPKALKAYQTLLVQFPEKKNIFAPRIKEIKVLIRENTKPGTK